MRALSTLLLFGLSSAACGAGSVPDDNGPFTYTVDGASLERPLLVGSQVTVSIDGLAAGLSHTLSSSNPAAIAVTATAQDLTERACLLPPCSPQAHFVANGVAEGTTEIRLFNQRGLVSQVSWAARPAAGLALRVWRNSSSDGQERVPQSADDPPTFTLKAGETVALGWDWLDAAGEHLVGTESVDFSSSDADVLGVTNVLGTIFSLTAGLPGTAELTATTGTVSVPFEFVVVRAL